MKCFRYINYVYISDLFSWSLITFSNSAHGIFSSERFCGLFAFRHILLLLFPTLLHFKAAANVCFSSLGCKNSPCRREAPSRRGRAARRRRCAGAYSSEETAAPGTCREQKQLQRLDPDQDQDPDQAETAARRASPGVAGQTGAEERVPDADDDEVVLQPAVDPAVGDGVAAVADGAAWRRREDGG